jgi:hypothetical protein
MTNNSQLATASWTERETRLQKWSFAVHSHRVRHARLNSLNTSSKTVSSAQRCFSLASHFETASWKRSSKPVPSPSPYPVWGAVSHLSPLSSGTVGGRSRSPVSCPN